MILMKITFSLHSFKRFDRFNRLLIVNMSEIIKKIFFSFHGAFLPKGDYIDDSLQNFRDSVYLDFEMSLPTEDRVNMKSDVSNLKSDFKKSVKRYKEETVDG